MIRRSQQLTPSSNVSGIGSGGTWIADHEPVTRTGTAGHDVLEGYGGDDSSTALPATTSSTAAAART